LDSFWSNPTHGGAKLRDNNDFLLDETSFELIHVFYYYYNQPHLWNNQHLPQNELSSVISSSTRFHKCSNGDGHSKKKKYNGETVSFSSKKNCH